MRDIIAYTMEHDGNPVESTVQLRRYTNDYYEDYKRIYEDCFSEMRTALELHPVNAGDSQEELLSKANDVYIYVENNELIGSVSILNNEIDDLIVGKKHQRKGYGRLFLNFAVARMQRKNISPITLRVADWNKGAIKLYLDNGFHITKTETIKRN